MIHNVTELRQTNDGSMTVYSTAHDECYHSHHGARQESEHVFIAEGLLQRPDDDYLNILELGFGTGLNALLTALGTEQPIYYESIEAQPLTPALHDAYSQSLDLTEQELYLALTQAPWETPIAITPTFTLQKRKTMFQNMTLHYPFDIVYYDAFSPRKQPECWTEAIFQTLFNALSPQGIVVTYCAKGAVRRGLAAVGFSVETITGPPGKRDMIRAIKP